MLAHPEQELPALGCLEIAHGFALLEQDALDAAEARLLRGLEQIGTVKSHVNHIDRSGGKGAGAWPDSSVVRPTVCCRALP